MIKMLEKIIHGVRYAILCMAIETFGKDSQIDMAIEEMAELTKALCKLKRARHESEKGACIANIHEEMADVRIMLDQLCIIFDKDTTDIENEKLERLCWYIEKKKIENDIEMREEQDARDYEEYLREKEAANEEQRPTRQ